MIKEKDALLENFKKKYYPLSFFLSFSREIRIEIIAEQGCSNFIATIHEYCLWTKIMIMFGWVGDSNNDNVDLIRISVRTKIIVFHSRRVSYHFTRPL